MAQVDALQARVDHLQKAVKTLKAQNSRLLAAQTGNQHMWEPMQQVEEPSSFFPSSGNDHKPTSGGLAALRDGATISPHNGQDEDTSQLVDDVANVFSVLKLTKSGDVSWFGPSSNLNLDDTAITSDDEKGPRTEEDLDKNEWVNDEDFSDQGQYDDSLDHADIDPKLDFLTDNSPTVSPGSTDTVAGEDPLYQASLQEHLLSLFWTWQHGFFVLVSKKSFVADLERARSRRVMHKRSKFYSPLLLNALLAHAAPLSRRLEVRSNRKDPKTNGDQFFKRAKRLLETEIESPSITTVQALALMGSREAGCGRNGLGWLYSGMSFRMALDLGLHLSCDELAKNGRITRDEADSRLMTFWGCYAYDKSWSAYLGKPESIPAHLIEGFPWPAISAEEEKELWMPYGEETTPLISAREPMRAHTSSTSRQIVAIQGILGSIIRNLYSTSGKGQRPNYSDMVTNSRCELFAWLRELPGHLKVRNHGFSASHLLPHVLVMHILYHTAIILLFRPFISQARSNCLPASFDPLGSCTNSAVKIVTLVKTYGRDYSLQFSHNMAVHGLFTASTIHLVNIVSKIDSYEHSARQNLFRSIELLKEMGETWRSAHRCLQVIWSIMDKHNISLAPAPVSDIVYPKSTTVPIDEDDYLYNTNMDYTYESRSRQRFEHSMPNLPQFVNHTDISGYSDHAQIPLAPRQRMNDIQDHEWNLAPGTLTFEADFDRQVPSLAVQENGPGQTNSYIYPDFDMSILNTIGVVTNTNGIFDFNHLDDNVAPPIKMMGTCQASVDSWLNPATILGDGNLNQRTVASDLWMHR